LTWKSVSAGYNHALALQTDGTLWSWGYNAISQAGYPNSGFPQPIPKQVGTVNTWKAVAAADQHSVGLRTDGTLWTWGGNSYGQLGIGNNTGPSACLSSSPCATSPVQVGSRTDWIAITASATHSLALRSDGTLWAWGFNDAGYLGIGSSSPDTCGVFGPCAKSPVQVGSASNWVAVSTGIRHTVAVRSDGTIWVWGWNGQGQLNLGNFTQQNSPVQMGSVATWTSVAAGYDASSALRSGGSLWAWGAFSLGQLGIGSTTSCVNSCPPTQVQVP
jgi:alpha-tubulin suppressor-like RCC1 family protein